MGELGVGQRGRTYIREFRETDAGAVVGLIHRTIDACYTGVYPPRAIAFFKDLHSRNGLLERSRSGVILVLERNTDVIGTGALVENEIYGVFVEPEMHGRGCGKAIMRELESRAVARGHGEVELSVSLPSRGFYEALGYEILGEASMDVGEGQALCFWKARKSLRISGLCADLRRLP